MAAIERTEPTARTTNITHLEFTQAMNDFKVMFPEVDEDVIEAVLRSNNGAVDATIDHLLTMSVDSENEKIRKELEMSDCSDEIPPRYTPSTPPPTYQQAVPHGATLSSPAKWREIDLTKSNLIDNVNLTSSSSSPLSYASKDSLRYKRQWQPPLIGTLPNDFLRVIVQRDDDELLPSNNVELVAGVSMLSSALLQQRMEENERQRKQSQSGIGPDSIRYLEDERFAILLQNEEFVQELRRNKDFMSTLEVDGQSQPGEPAIHSDMDAFKETLRNMGKASRRKFAQLAKLFSRRKRPSFQQLLGGTHSDTGNPSRDNLLNLDDNYTEFENEDTSDNEATRTGQTSARNGVTNSGPLYPVVTGAAGTTASTMTTTAAFGSQSDDYSRNLKS